MSRYSDRAFTISRENTNIPSIFAEFLNITVITPSAMPYSTLPPFVNGSVCGSLARNIKPNSTNPLTKRNITASIAGSTLLVR